VKGRGNGGEARKEEDEGKEDHVIRETGNLCGRTERNLGSGRGTKKERERERRRRLKKDYIHVSERKKSKG